MVADLVDLILGVTLVLVLDWSPSSLLTALNPLCVRVWFLSPICDKVDLVSSEVWTFELLDTKCEAVMLAMCGRNL